MWVESFTPEKDNESIHQNAELNIIFLIKYMRLSQCFFFKRFVFDWLHCGAKHCVQSDIIIHVFRYVYANCDVLHAFLHFLIHIFFCFYFYARYQEKSFFISDSSRSNFTKVASKHLPSKLNMLSQSHCQIKSQEHHCGMANLSTYRVHIAAFNAHVRFSNAQYVSIRQKRY